MVAHSSDGLSATAPVTGGDVLVDTCVTRDEKTQSNGRVPEQLTEERVQLPTVDAFRRAIPAHCFERDLVKSLRYLIQDFAALALLYFVLPAFEYFGLFGYLVWNCLMGVFGFALFVVGHDCLHGSFSENQVINDIIGHVAFAPLFSPYFPWQKSHKLHHAVSCKYSQFP